MFTQNHDWQLACPLAGEICFLVALMILLAITLPVIGREGTIRRSPDCLFYQTMWLPSSGGKYRLTLVKMEQEWGRGRGKLLHKGPICAAQLCISIAKNTTCHIDTQWVSLEQMNTTETVKGEGFCSSLGESCQRSHPLFTWAVGFRMQMGSAATAYSTCQVSDCQILRPQILNLESMCGLQRF